MNPPRATDRQYIDPEAPAHDAFSRLLARLEPDPETVWQEVRPLVRRADCIGGSTRR